ncbi:saccharopine dehydrogenase family protein [uncultured Jatrophihabitans sp.]|uniref:saccharopine dehydrogenase family protein n=1 Tax=uncultured Jatrophihabitans sp. TaxID=1610747 RepID=UPI0035CBD39F
MTARDERPFDIVVFGATGFAGRLTAEYLVSNAPPDCRLALAGRNTAKLAQVRHDLAALDPAFADTALLVADTGDESSLREMAQQTRVLITTVGPYVLYGDAVVAACAASGTDYLDLTGEPEFVNTSYVRHHRTALDTGARLIHAAGFDSIPHDLGALFTVEQLPADEPLTVQGYLRASGAFSGGTYHSAITAFSRPRRNLAAARERRELEPHDGARSAQAVTGRPHRDPVNGGWAVPLPTIDPQIVARSARAVPRYGPDFRYAHFATLPNVGIALGGALGVGGLFALAQIPPARRLLLGRLQPGDGPSAERRAKSWFAVTFVGAAESGERVVTRVSGGDPGYDETAKMLAESALSLAFDELPATAGQVTTATALGDALVDRLRKAGIGFDVLT